MSAPDRCESLSGEFFCLYNEKLHPVVWTEFLSYSGLFKMSIINFAPSLKPPLEIVGI